jgi:hypothetical protein
MTTVEFHQLVALLQGQFVQIERRLGQVLGHCEELARRLDRLEQKVAPRSPEKLELNRIE